MGERTGTGRGLRRALLASTALVAVVALLATPALANGGAGSAGQYIQGSGGADSPTGTGGSGLDSAVYYNGGGGGGAGVSGGVGGNVPTFGANTGGSGGAGGNTVGNPGLDGQVGGNGTNNGGGGGGGGGAHGFVGPALPTAAATGGAGGNGGQSGTGVSSDGGGGGAGGFGAVVTGTGNLGTLGVNVTGGGGGNGGSSLSGSGAFYGGNAGSGGAGFYATQGVALTSTATVAGGAGGVGGVGRNTAGSGGAGGNAFTFAGAGSALTSTGSALAGNGGAGGNGSNGGARNGNGGAGGIGVQFVLGGGVLTNGGTVRGGDGGNSGTGGNGIATQGSFGGAGGAGVSFGGTSGTLINTGTISGGFGGTSLNPGRVGDGGVGVVGAGLTINNTGGTIEGGIANGGAGAQALAIRLTGGTNYVGTGGTISSGIGIEGTATFAPALPTAPVGPALIVQGPVTFASGSTYLVRVTPNASDRTTLTGGTATLNGASVSVLAGAGTYAATNTYTILSATTVAGTFGTVTSNMAFLTPSLSYPSNTVVLTLTQTAQMNSAATNSNQTSTANAVQSSVPASQPAASQPAASQPAASSSQSSSSQGSSDPGTSSTQQSSTPAAPPTPAQQVASAVITQTTDGARAAFNALSGEVQASSVTAVAQAAFAVQDAILDHMRFGEGNGFGQAGVGTTGALGSRFAPGTTLTAAYSADRPGGAVVSQVPLRFAVAPAYSLWGQAYGSFGQSRTNGNASTLNRAVGGFVFGADTGLAGLTPVLSEWRAGVAAGYSYTDFSVPLRQSQGTVESGYGAVYARGPLVGPLQVRLGAAYIGNALDTRRVTQFPGFADRLTGRASGDVVQGFGELGYRAVFSAGYLEPFVGGAALSIHRNGFTERGGVSALTVFGRTYDIQTATAGVQGQVVLSELLGTGGMPIIARGLVGYRRAFGDVVPSALLVFTGGGQGFITSGVPIARDAVVASAGLDWQVAPAVTLGVSYTGQAGRRAEDHGVKGSFSYRF